MSRFYIFHIGPWIIGHGVSEDISIESSSRIPPDTQPHALHRGYMRS